jgi:hypothetical protein
MYKDTAIEEIRERRRLLFKKYEQEHPERFAKISPIKQHREIVE